MEAEQAQRLHQSFLMGGIMGGVGGEPGMGLYSDPMFPQLPQMWLPPYGFPPMIDPATAAFMMGGKGSGFPVYGMGMPKGSGGARAKGKGKGKGRDGGQRKEKAKSEKKTMAKGKAKGKAAPPPAEDDANVKRSAVLIEVCKHCGRCTIPLADVLPNILELAQDQHGSLFLRALLDGSSDDERLQIFAAILPHAAQLANNRFGWFVLHRLLDVAKPVERRQLAEQFQGMVLQLSNESNGCRVIQMALQCLPQEQRSQLASELKGHVVACIENMHGNHVIQKCIEYSYYDINFIYDELDGRFVELASHKYGCRIIQRLLEYQFSHWKRRSAKLNDTIVKSCKKLAMDPFGNYVISHMLEFGRKEDKVKILQMVIANLEELSFQKYSNNIVEKSLEVCVVNICGHAQELRMERKQLFLAALDPGAVALTLVEQQSEEATVLPPTMLQIVVIPESDLLRVTASTMAGRDLAVAHFPVEAPIADVLGWEALRQELSVRGRALPMLEANDGNGIVSKEEALGSRKDFTVKPQPPFLTMLDDKFGIYVARSMIEYSKGDERQLLKEKLTLAYQHLRTSKYGKDILAQAEELLFGHCQ